MKGIFLKYVNYIFFILLFILINSCEKEVFVEPSSISKVQYSLVYITSNPQGAEIYMDGKTTGAVTPDTIKWLEEKNHVVTLRMKYYFDTTFTVNSKISQPLSISIDYYKSERMLGSIICTSKPAGAAVYLDNINTGKVTPVTLSHLLPKEYSVKFDFPEYRKDSISVILKSMETKNANALLDDTLDVIKYVKSNSGLPQDLITGVAEDKNGNIWLGTGSEGLVKFDGKKFTNFRAENSSFVSSNYIKKVKSDKENNIWVGYSNSIARYNGTNWESVATDAISMIQISSDNTMLASTDKRGIVKYSNGKFEWITNSNSGLPYNELVSMCYDKSGKLWAAPRFGDLFYNDNNNWIKVDSAKDGMPYSHCCGINLSSEGNIIAMFYLQPNGPASTTPHSLVTLRNGIWYRMFEKVTAFIEDKDLFIDSKNRTWYSYMSPYPLMARISNSSFTREYFYNNIIKHDIRKFKSWLYTSVESFFNGRQVFIDSKGNLWLFGDVGLIKLKAGRWNN